MRTEAQKAADKRYRKKKNIINIEFSPAQSALWEFLKKQENKSGYIKNLIKQDMQKDGD